MKNLDAAEHEIIFYAKEENGEIRVMKTQAGKSVTVGEKQFGDWDNSRERTKYLDALDSLQDKKLVKHEEGILYCLTSEGFEIADALGFSSIPDFEQSQNTQPNPKPERPTTSPHTYITNNYDLNGANIGNWAENQYGTQQTTQVQPNPSQPPETPK